MNLAAEIDPRRQTTPQSARKVGFSVKLLALHPGKAPKLPETRIFGKCRIFTWAAASASR